MNLPLIQQALGRNLKMYELNQVAERTYYINCPQRLAFTDKPTEMFTLLTAEMTKMQEERSVKSSMKMDGT